AGGEMQFFASRGVTHHHGEERGDQPDIDERLVNPLIDGPDVVVLPFVKRENAVMLADDMPVGPEANEGDEGLEGEQVALHVRSIEDVAGADQAGAGQWEGETAEKEALAFAALLAIEVGAGISAEKVRDIEE